MLMEQLHKELGRLPKALFTASYTLLEGVLRYLNEHNLLNALLNKEMRLVTFDNHDLLDCLPLNIDSIAQNSEELAKRSSSYSAIDVQPKCDTDRFCLGCHHSLAKRIITFPDEILAPVNDKVSRGFFFLPALIYR